MFVCLVDTYEVCGMALNQRAYKISSYPDHPASLANDGLTSTYFRSLNETNPWWMVRLYYWINVTAVILSNADNDSCCNRKSQS